MWRFMSSLPRRNGILAFSFQDHGLARLGSIDIDGETPSSPACIFHQSLNMILALLQVTGALVSEVAWSGPAVVTSLRAIRSALNNVTELEGLYELMNSQSLRGVSNGCFVSRGSLRSRRW